MPSSCLSAMHLVVLLASPYRVRHPTPLAGYLLCAALFVGRPGQHFEGDPAAGGMAYDTARDALAKLVDAGMPGKDGTVYSVPADVVEIADRLAVLVGGSTRPNMSQLGTALQLKQCWFSHGRRTGLDFPRCFLNV